ncbi:hypothetical protein EWH08_09600 [Sphingobium indicum]|uniref:Uncharacterized protein n=1 Tax=Sphingobium indicum TaxID=332055 RepID=A0A4Q4J811_9SPHN|nr:hypothetical protein [Sphingobium indicum]NYI22561.1 hypothetical protein [Sphingobium indicum]RYM02454.1 hypothetical protein EWH08_09600 [Sphingobium indicum]
MMKNVSHRSPVIGRIYGCGIAAILGFLAYNLMNFRISHCNSEECIHEIATGRILVVAAAIVLTASAAGFIINRLQRRP